MRRVSLYESGRIAAIATLAMLGSAHPMQQAAAADIDPTLAKPWEFVQQAMPGVPYSVLAAACAEREMTLYHGTWTEAQVLQVKHFQERFPCLTVKRLGMQASAARERFLAEYRAGRPTADILQDTDPGALDKAAESGALMNYTISNDAAYADALKKKGFWYPLRIGLVGIAYNTTLVTDQEARLLLDWKGLTNPIWKGRLGVVDANGVDLLPWYAFARLYGEGFVQQIGTLAPHVYSGNNPAAAALASGDVGVILTTETGISPFYLKGAPIRWTLPEPGLGIVTGQGIASNAPHPNAAKLYQEYSFTLEGYTYWQTLGGAPSRNEYKDQREVASQPWYKYPKTFFEFDPADFTKSAQATRDMLVKWMPSSH